VERKVPRLLDPVGCEKYDHAPELR
jgi:hypothetical protein